MVCRAIGVNLARRIPDKGTVCAKVLWQEGTYCVAGSEGSGQLNASMRRDSEAMLLKGQTGVSLHGALHCRPGFRFHLNLGAHGKGFEQAVVGLRCDWCLLHFTEELGFSGKDGCLDLSHGGSVLP